MNVNDLVRKIADKRAERGFVTHPLKIHLLLTEEVGEIAGELKKLWSPNYSSFEREKLASEIADAFCLLSALAHQFNIDLEQAVENKFFRADEDRSWASHTGKTSRAE